MQKVYYYFLKGLYSAVKSVSAPRGAWSNAVSVLKAGDFCILALEGQAANVDQVLQAKKGTNILQFGACTRLVDIVPRFGFNDGCRYRCICNKFSIHTGALNSKHFDFFV